MNQLYTLIQVALLSFVLAYGLTIVSSNRNLAFEQNCIEFAETKRPKRNIKLKFKRPYWKKGRLRYKNL